MIKYKGYVGKDSTLKVFYGDGIGLTHVITFEGTMPATVERSLKHAIDDYLELCVEEGIVPET